MSVVIRRVIVNPPGPDEQAESLQLHNSGNEDVDLTGWTLSDTQNHPGPVFTFHFPSFTLLSGADVSIHTGDGTDDGQNLFWKSTSAVWNNKGDRATLRDATGAEVDHADWPSAPQEGRVIKADEIGQALLSGVPTVGDAHPTGALRWTTLGPSGGEIFWQEYGDTAAAFHTGFPDSIPPGAPVPEDPIIVVRDSIYRHYLNLGGPKGLGRPLTRARDVGEHGRRIVRQEFEGGSIYWTADTGPALIKGAIRDKWLNAEAGANGRMGVPINEERSEDGGLIFQDFERGSIWFVDGVAEVIIGLVIEFTGFHCFGEQQGPGSDEPYFHVSVVPINPPVENPKAIDDGLWFTMLPADGRVSYENIDSHDTQPDLVPVFIGRAAPLVLKTFEFEHDNGDPNAFRQQIKDAVALAGAITAAFVPAASVVALNPEAQNLVADVINRIVDSDDDFIGQTQVLFNSRREIRDILNTPTHEEFPGVPLHKDSGLITDGDASYKSYYRLRRWEPK
jgi:hypothetical protein